jgi:hypothetical protein
MSELDANDRRSWVELARDENRAIWNGVYADLVVDPARPPKFVEPRGSVTWELRDVPETPRHTIDQVEVIVGTQLRRALEALVGAEQWVYGLDWQHPGYRFFPAEAKNPVNSESWCIPTVPNGDYCLFLAHDLRFGWLGHPWEPTICVYGDLLALMGPVLDDMGWPVIRTGRRRRQRRRRR